MKKIFVLLLALLLATALFTGCDMRNGKVTNSPGVTHTPGNTPGHTPVVTDVPAPSATATHTPAVTATPGTGPSPTGEPERTAAPTANTTAGFGI